MQPVAALWLFALLLAALCAGAYAAPAGLHELPDARAPVSALASRVTSHGDRVTSHGERAARLPLPSPQELEALRKVAQILAMLGQQVIPTIIGEAPASSPGTQDTPEDDVDDDD